MKIACLIAQYLLGLGFTVFGLNGFLHFIPQPPVPPGHAADFVGVMAATHYMVPVFATQLACGLLFLANRFVPLALVVVAPVLVNILLFHALMAPSGLLPGAIFTVLWIVTAYRVWPAFSGLLQARAPTVRAGVDR